MISNIKTLELQIVLYTLFVPNYLSIQFRNSFIHKKNINKIECGIFAWFLLSLEKNLLTFFSVSNPNLSTYEIVLGTCYSKLYTFRKIWISNNVFLNFQIVVSYICWSIFNCEFSSFYTNRVYRNIEGSYYSEQKPQHWFSYSMCITWKQN